MNNKTNKQRKNKVWVLFHLPHKSLILKVIKKHIHVAYQVHIGKCMQTVDTLECCNIGGVIVSELATSEVDCVCEPKSGQIIKV